MSSLLEIDSVIKFFDLNQVLTDIYLKCETGDIIGMLGRNGAGKSTLLKILFGTLPSDRKFIRIDGQVFNDPYKTKSLLSFLPQFSFLPKNLTVKKVVELYVGFPNISSFFEDSDLKVHQNKRISNLSGGERRYLEVKLVLSASSKFVLLDEPFNGSSPILIEKIKELITEASKTKGIILTDHDFRNILGVANRLCLIYDGGIKTIKSEEELIRWGYLSSIKTI